MTKRTLASGAGTIFVLAIALYGCPDSDDTGGTPDGGASSSSSGGSSSGGSSSGGSSSGGSSSGGSSSGGSGGFGTGAYGALPNGYCCATNDDCRHRNCVETGGGKMCLDRCDAPTGCLRRAGGFTCQMTGGDGRCQPDMGTTCIPSGQFERGSKVLGDCCTATHDANAGLECQGGHCGAFGADSNPFICTQVCRSAVDCPGPYLCLNTGDYKICAPQASTYTCK